jgi:dephospho-CoA kinase
MPGIASVIQQPVIGITGGMGSGKSVVARYLYRRFGGALIDADAVCRELMEPGATGWDAFRSTFGAEYLNPDQSINRPLLRRVIFLEEEKRRRLESLLHPLAKKEIVRRIGEARAVLFLIEVPLLFEAGWDREMDRIIVVYADHASCRIRLMKRDRMNAADAAVAMATQWPLAAKALQADHVIDNSGNWAATCLQILHLGELLWQLAGKEEHIRPSCACAEAK